MYYTFSPYVYILACSPLFLLLFVCFCEVATFPIIICFVLGYIIKRGVLGNFTIVFTKKMILKFLKTHRKRIFFLSGWCYAARCEPYCARLWKRVVFGRVFIRIIVMVMVVDVFGRVWWWWWLFYQDHICGGGLWPRISANHMRVVVIHGKHCVPMNM